ncbi:MAG: VOC family protein [Methylococcales bacterium]|nr:VOC family protein [Methylococcales bacterium]MCK5925352.1 VOC family protein [Methylococcales bacterium]
MTTAPIHFSKIDHHSVISSNIEKSTFFYHNILGLEIDSERPALKYGGAWFIITEGVAIHCLCLPNYDPVEGRPEHGGLDRHVALRIENLEPLLAQLNAHNIVYTHSKSGRAAIFFRDPDGNAVEVIEN